MEIAPRTLADLWVLIRRRGSQIAAPLEFTARSPAIAVGCRLSTGYGLHCTSGTSLVSFTLAET